MLGIENEKERRRERENEREDREVGRGTARAAGDVYDRNAARDLLSRVVGTRLYVFIRARIARGGAVPLKPR